MIKENRKLLLDLLIKDRKKYMNLIKLYVKSTETAEDIYQLVAESILTNEMAVNLDYPKAFIGTLIKNRCLNYRRDNYKYSSNIAINHDNVAMSDYLDSIHNDSRFEKDLIDSLTFEKVLEKIGELTEKQKEAVLGSLYYDSTAKSAAGVNYNTHKSNRLWGIQALQKSLNA